MPYFAYSEKYIFSLTRQGFITEHTLLQEDVNWLMEFCGMPFGLVTFGGRTCNPAYFFRVIDVGLVNAWFNG